MPYLVYAIEQARLSLISTANSITRILMMTLSFMITLTGREKKRQRSMMKHRGIDKESIKMHKHTVTRLLEEYNTHCGDESGQNVCIYTHLFNFRRSLVL